MAVQKGKSLHLSGGTVVNLGQLTAPSGLATVAAIPGERRVRLNSPGQLLSLDISNTVLTEGINPLALPELLTATPEAVEAKAIAPLGNVLVEGNITAEQIDLYAAGQVTLDDADSSDAGLIEGDTRVVRFSVTGENPDQAVFIDRRADNPTDLLYGAAAGTITQIIEKDEKGITAVGEQLAMISDSVGKLDSVAIIAEGNQGNFWLGSDWIRADNIAHYTAQLQAWGQALTSQADLLLYSCFTALGSTGKTLVASLAEITGADVAASVNATSSTNYGGDWVLETQTGTIAAENPFTNATLDQWDGKLAIRTVTNLNDSGASSLREALTGSSGFSGVALADGDTVNFSVSGTIALSADIAWSVDNVTIDGVGQTVVVDGGGVDTVFDISAPNATLSNLTIQNGSSTATGGGIRHSGAGTLTLNTVTVTNNTAVSDGGGISSDGGGTLALINSTISNNSSGPGGGGIVLDTGGILTVQNSTISNNQASSSGGGINSDGTVTIIDSTISGNSARDGGGIKTENGAFTLTNSTVSGNSATGGTSPGGGGILIRSGNATLTNSTVSGNSADYGGGIEHQGGSGETLTLTNSTVSGNTAGRQGGGIHSTSNISLDRSTLSGNTSTSGGGGIWINSTLTAVNSTISGNSSSARGGGVFVSNAGVLNLANDTIAFNTANDGGGIHTTNSNSHSIVNTIIANNTAASTGTTSDLETSGSFNNSTVQYSLLTSTAGQTGITLTNGVNGNIIGQDPLLGPLQNNGGSTQTHALLAGSPAINAGNNSFVTVDIDQTGEVRIMDFTVDIGAYELQTITSFVLPTTCELFWCEPRPIKNLKRFERRSRASRVDPIVEDTEAQMTNDYAKLRGNFRPPRPPSRRPIRRLRQNRKLATLSLSQIQDILREIERQTGEVPALVYYTFVPRAFAEASATEAVPETYIASTLANPLSLATQTDAIAAAAAQDALQLILVTPEAEPVVVPLSGVTRSQVQAQTRRLRRAIATVRQGYLDPAQTLHNWLITPIQAQLELHGITNLSVIAAEGLRAIPVAALHNGEQFLVEQYSLAQLPSLSLIDWQYQPLDAANVVAMGAAKFVTQSPLPAVPTELELITGARSRPTFLNDQFTYANLAAQSQARQFQILHLATHAQFQAGAAERAYIQLWGQEQLQLNTLQDLKLYENPAVELLVLSACDTALGDAEAELGFAGAALQTGVKSVLASLWQVSDLGTLVLMDAFYEALAEPTVTIKAEALRQAQLALLAGEANLEALALAGVTLSPELEQFSDVDLTHPYYWSAFTVVGSPW